MYRTHSHFNDDLRIRLLTGRKICSESHSAPKFYFYKSISPILNLYSSNIRGILRVKGRFNFIAFKNNDRFGLTEVIRNAKNRVFSSQAILFE